LKNLKAEAPSRNRKADDIVEADEIIAASPTATAGNKYSTFVDGLEYVNSLTEAFTKDSEATEEVKVSIKTYSATDVLGKYTGNRNPSQVHVGKDKDTVVKTNDPKGAARAINKRNYEKTKQQRDRNNAY
jgi:hypothetical protein